MDIIQLVIFLKYSFMAFSTFLPMILVREKHENDSRSISFVPLSILLGHFKVYSHPINSHSVDFKKPRERKRQRPDLSE